MQDTLPLHVQTIIHGLRARGFTEGPPTGMKPAARTIDREVCQEADCESCGHPGLTYRPFHRQSSYVALAVCPDCRNATEF